MSWRLPSYRSADCCRNDCHSGWEKDQPCWGQTTVTGEVSWGDDDWGWVHECDGHAYCHEGEPYKVSTNPEDQGVEPVEDDE
jgi:hypothetical protein